MPDNAPLDQNFLDSVPGSRRNFLKKMAAVAFAAPVISVFTMDSTAFAGQNRGPKHHHPNQTYPNQTYPNQTDDGDCRPRQHHPNQTYGNQTFPGHTYGNQTYYPPAWDRDR